MREAIGPLRVEESGVWGWLGELIGRVIGWLLSVAGAIWDAIGAAVGSFFTGVARGIGVEDPGWTSYLVLGFSLLLLFFAVRGFLRRALLAPLLLTGLGLACIALIIA